MASSIYHNWQCSDCSFVTEVPAELLCPVCFRILRDPFQSQCCGQHYCYDCLQAQLRKGKSCVSCESKLRGFRDVNAANRVNALAVKCSHEAYGCTWRGELGGLGEHLLQCAKRPVRCDLCEDHVLSEHLTAHKSTQCMKRTFRCLHCNDFESTYETVRDYHWPKCPYYPIPCPNRCSEDSIPRGRVLQHLREKCDATRKLKEKISEMEEQLKARDAKIEQLEKEVKEKRSRTKSITDRIKLRSKPSSSASHVEETEHENAQLVERIAELEKHIETQEQRINELTVQKRNFKENMDRMAKELTSQQEVMRDVTDKLRADNEKLQEKLSRLGSGEESRQDPGRGSGQESKGESGRESGQVSGDEFGSFSNML